jgi:hypothetical protein
VLIKCHSDDSAFIVYFSMQSAFPYTYKDFDTARDSFKQTIYCRAFGRNPPGWMLTSRLAASD